MKRVMVSVLLIMIALSVQAQEFREILEVDSAVQGVWHVWAISYDGGATLTYKSGEAILRMYGTYLLNSDGSRVTFESIQFFKDTDGVIYNIVKLEGYDTMWSISKENPPYILVQVWDTNTSKETMRLLVKQ